jgi:D-beta-D-heptose 7-phosphate kinase/D-beta-D-heptose 1-phosphate adenosyltransferase
MMNKISKIIQEQNEKILVYGDVVIDVYKNNKTIRVSSECPIPVFEEINSDEKIILGGAGNVLNNLLLLNKNCKILSIIEEKYINVLVNSENVINVKDEEYKNIIKTRHYSYNQQSFRIDSANNYTMSEVTIQKIKNTIDEIIHNYKFIIISDYNTGIINECIVEYIISESNKLNITTIIDPKNKYKIYKNCSVIKSNRQDAEKFSGKTINNIEDAYDICDIFLQQLNVNECIITLSENGCVYTNTKKERIHINSEKNINCEIMDVTGAGDTFISTFTLGLTNKINIKENLELCNLFCSDVIKRKYTSCVCMLELFKKVNFIFSESNCYLLKNHLLDKKIVFTSGCFDLLHEGHIEILKKGKEIGDILVVALNDDSSIKKNKGETRPINNLNTRLSILSSIKYVDFIIVFSETTPNNIYNIIKPDILIKGDDYSFEKIREIFPSVENFVSVSLINNISTTNIINKIKSHY